MNILKLYRKILRYITIRNKKIIDLKNKNNELEIKIASLEIQYTIDKEILKTKFKNKIDKQKLRYVELSEIKEQYKQLIQEYKFLISSYRQKLKTFDDEYFRGLTNEEIAELAKKSIRLTALKSNLEYKLADIKEILYEAQSKSENLMIGDFKQYFDEEFIEKIYTIIDRSEE